MAIKRPKPEEIVAKLRQVEVLTGQAFLRAVDGNGHVMAGATLGGSRINKSTLLTVFIADPDFGRRIHRKIAAHYCDRPHRIYTVDRAEIVWTDADQRE